LYFRWLTTEQFGFPLGRGALRSVGLKMRIRDLVTPHLRDRAYRFGDA